MGEDEDVKPVPDQAARAEPQFPVSNIAFNPRAGEIEPLGGGEVDAMLGDVHRSLVFVSVEIIAARHGLNVTPIRLMSSKLALRKSLA